MPPSVKDSLALSVLFATPECAPLAKTGGLGDVSAALPAALRELGVDVRVLLPGYPEVLAADRGARELASLEVFGAKARLLESRLPSGVTLLVIDSPYLYGRAGGPYQDDQGDDWHDNVLRFGVLSKIAAILGTADSPLKWRPEVVHCNDWPTALAPVYLRDGASRPGTLITIHNLAFQGVFPYADVEGLDIPERSRGMDGIEYHGRASFLKGALVCADAITTVSPTYAKEIQGAELGFGLDGVLRSRAGQLHGLLNGIDTVLWNPESDPHLACSYGAATLQRKALNKTALKQRFGLAGGDHAPLLGLVGRLTHQKGIDILIEAMPRIAAMPAQVIVIGQGERELVESLQEARRKLPQALAVHIGFDEASAHLLEAGADMFLMPSRFEPCGMNQMYSQRYGTPPIANATGGLVDTIASVDVAGRAATGFLMRKLDADSLVEQCRLAIDEWRHPDRWRRLQLNGMARDFGWGTAARAYAELYRQLKPTS